jgi:PTH2 family peptidyl-tRNA hydrolase
MRQLILVRKDLNMSPGKLAAQVSHASMAFLTQMIRTSGVHQVLSMDTGEPESYDISLNIQADIYEKWINGIFTKTICEAKNKNQLMKAVQMAEEIGLKEGKDYFLIKDHCLTELEPEEIGEDGIGKTLTCIGFRPLPDDIAHAISRKYQLYK